MLLRSRDDLQQQLGGCLPSKQFTGEDQWFSKEKLYKVRVMVLQLAMMVMILVKRTMTMTVMMILVKPARNCRV